MENTRKSQMSWWGEMQDMIDYYFVYGKTMDDVISGYRTLTGKIPGGETLNLGGKNIVSVMNLIFFYV